MVNRRGVGAFGCLIYLLVVGGVVYFGSGVGSAYIDYYRYRDAMKQEAEFSLQRSDMDIKSRLKIFADSLGLSPSASMVRINRSPARVTIVGSYLQSVPVPLFGPRKIRFSPTAEATF